MSRLRIQHTTCYRYARPVEFGPHRLVLRPREGHDVNVVSMGLDISPRHSLRWARDVFGNSIGVVEFHAPAAELRIVSDVVIERSPPFPREPRPGVLHAPFPPQYDPLEATVVAAYQNPTYPEELPIVSDWVRRRLGDPTGLDCEQVLRRLGAAVHESVRYRRRMEKGVQTPEQTIALGSGSCRDKTTLMMDAVRSLGLAARFASGYLDCPASEAGRASMHAWIEVYVPTLGWWGFDPTINEPTSLKHVVAGVSNHPRGVMPVSGSFHGTSQDYLGLEATVRIDRLDSLADDPSATSGAA